MTGTVLNVLRRTAAGWMTGMVLGVMLCGVVYGQVRPPAPPGPRPAAPSQGDRLKFKNSPLEMLLTAYSDKTGRTLLLAPSLPKGNVTLESKDELSPAEYLLAIEKVLAMNGIAVLKEGDKFLKVVPIDKVRQEEMGIRDLGDAPKDTGEMVSQMIPLLNINVAEAKQAIDALKHPYAQVYLFERINSILLTDTAGNVARIMEILKYVDQPAEAKEVPNIIEIHYAKASEVKQKLEEIIAESQKDAEKLLPKAKTSGAPGVETVRVAPAVPGVVRPQPAAQVAKPPQGAEELISMADRGIVVGKVKIIADDRTNILIIITRKENMAFFETIIRVLDVETTPDVVVKIIRLEYADAENVASTLNSLIGGKPAEKVVDPKAPVQPGQEGKSAALTEYVNRLEQQVASVGKEKSKFGELSAANIKILPDKRTNAILIMASKADFAALDEMIRDMDIMLSQVLIEVVIFKIGLVNANERGIDWIQRALLTYEKDAAGSKSPIMAFAGAIGGAKDRSNMKDPLTLTSQSSLSSAGGNLAYFFTFFDYNLDAIIKLVASDNRTQVLSSPQILTTDNKAASINVTSEKYFFKGLKFVSTSGSGAGEWVDDVEMKKVGTKLTVTPHINEKKYVVMEITQSLEEEGTGQEIRGGGGASTWPTIDSSEITASVAVRNRETIVLGGMVSKAKRTEESKVPFLGDIPILGNLFKRNLKYDQRGEVVVFITPYVLNTPEEIEKETARIRTTVEADGLWPKGWSSSKLADVPKDRRGRLIQTKPAAAPAAKASGPAKSAPEPASVPAAVPAVISATNTATVGDAAVPVPAPAPDALPPVEPVAPATNDVAAALSETRADMKPEIKQLIDRQGKRRPPSLKDVNAAPPAPAPGAPAPQPAP